MSTANPTQQFNVTIPIMGVDTFNKLAKVFNWVATPTKVKSAEKKMSMAEIHALADSIDRINNPKRLKITSAEIDEIVKDCRDEK